MSGASSQVSDPGSHPIANQKLFLTLHSLSVVHSKLIHLSKWGQSEPWLLRALGTVLRSWLAPGPCGSHSASQGLGLPLGPRENSPKGREPVPFGKEGLFGPLETGPWVCRAACALDVACVPHVGPAREQCGHHAHPCQSWVNPSAPSWCGWVVFPPSQVGGAALLDSPKVAV